MRSDFTSRADAELEAVVGSFIDGGLAFWKFLFYEGPVVLSPLAGDAVGIDSAGIVGLVVVIGSHIGVKAGGAAKFDLRDDSAAVSQRRKPEESIVDAHGSRAVLMESDKTEVFGLEKDLARMQGIKKLHLTRVGKSGRPSNVRDRLSSLLLLRDKGKLGRAMQGSPGLELGCAF